MLVVSGEMTKKQEALTRLSPGLTALALLVPGLGGLLFAFYKMAPDSSVQIYAISFLVVLSAAVAGFTYWDDRNVILRFVCSEGALQFCIIGAAVLQERTLADVTAVYDRRFRGGSLVGYWLVFQDGTRVCLSADTPGAVSLVQYLRSACQLRSPQ